jgi:hypothetical protein
VDQQPTSECRVGEGVLWWDQQRARVREALGLSLSSKHDPASNAFAVPGQPSINIASPTCFVAIPPALAFALLHWCTLRGGCCCWTYLTRGNPVPTYSRLVHPHLPCLRLVCSAPTLSRPDGPPQPAQCPMTAREDVSPALLLSDGHAAWFFAA